MRKRINFDIFKRNQLKAQLLKNPLQQSLYTASYQLINDLLSDIKRPFKNICIHGFYQPMMIDYLIKHNAQYQQLQQSNSNPANSSTQVSPKPKITIVDYLNFEEPKTYQNQIFQTQVVTVENNDAFLPQQDEFDLLISGLELNHTNNQQTMLQKYLRTLKPDGALIGCAMVQGTLSQLHWSYLMAENERSGGLSPKVLNFPSIGQLGNLLTMTHYHLATILNRDIHLEFDSPLQVLKAIEMIGQSGHLRGRRKAVYKELLVAMYAMYQSEFSFQSIQEQKKCEKVLSTVVLSPFVGWKYSKDQPKPLRRGQHGDAIDFIDELRKHDPDLEHFRISEDSDQLQEVNPGNRKKGDGNDKE